jgi:two-component system sensor histidine kinase and response regulator WspE
VRVSADNLNRLMGLAGESLVEAKQLRPIVDSLVHLRILQLDLWEQLQRLEESLSQDVGPVAERAQGHVGRIKQQATRCLDDLGLRIDRMESHARRNEDLSERLHHEVISSRLRPFQDGVRGFPRLVRDVARQLGKSVHLEILGEQTGVDRDILEKLEAPLNHLIRNALDHGIESLDERRTAGKPETASLKLEARHVAGMLQITLTDDGRGIDIEKIRTRIVEREMTTPEMASRMTEPELLEFLFLSGFSTRSEVTSLSGRGVGLDVVQSMVQSVGGSVRLTTQLGRGTCFSLQLPITMSVIRALLVTIGGEPYAFPLSRLDRIGSVPGEDVEVIEGRQFFKLDDQTIGLVSAAQVLERPAGAGAAAGEPLQVVVISDRGQSFGVVVDAILGERDLDVRPLDPRLGKVPNLNSASVLEDGWPVLIIDVEDLVRSIDNIVHGRRLRASWRRDGGKTVERRVKSILVVDDSITVRELERQLLESRGYHVETAVDGVDGWNAARTGHFDLIVSDIDMPRMDGIQLVRHIKSDARLRPVPVVIVSYKERQEDRLRGLDAGADAYLTKSSFRDETFLNTVSDLIGEPRE